MRGRAFPRGPRSPPLRDFDVGTAAYVVARRRSPAANLRESTLMTSPTLKVSALPQSRRRRVARAEGARQGGSPRMAPLAARSAAPSRLPHRRASQVAEREPKRWPLNRATPNRSRAAKAQCWQPPAPPRREPVLPGMRPRREPAARRLQGNYQWHALRWIGCSPQSSFPRRTLGRHPVFRGKLTYTRWSQALWRLVGKLEVPGSPSKVNEHPTPVFRGKPRLLLALTRVAAAI